jgi:Uma2 family endonuclease
MLDVRQIAPETLRPLRRVEYERLVALGAFEGERVELLDGVLVRMSPHGPAHDAALDRLTEIFIRALGLRAKVRVHGAFVAGDGSEPEPDLAIVPRREYDDAHPDQAYLIIEVAESSLLKDRSVKAKLYAESGVREYWIVNLTDRVIEVYTSPTSDGYGAAMPFRKGDGIRLQEFPDLEIKVDDVVRWDLPGNI